MQTPDVYQPSNRRSPAWRPVSPAWRPASPAWAPASPAWERVRRLHTGRARDHSPPPLEFDPDLPWISSECERTWSIHIVLLAEPSSCSLFLFRIHSHSLRNRTPTSRPAPREPWVARTFFSPRSSQKVIQFPNCAARIVFNDASTVTYVRLHRRASF